MKSGPPHLAQQETSAKTQQRKVVKAKLAYYENGSNLKSLQVALIFRKDYSHKKLATILDGREQLDLNQLTFESRQTANRAPCVVVTYTYSDDSTSEDLVYGFNSRFPDLLEFMKRPSSATVRFLDNDANPTSDVTFNLNKKLSGGANSIVEDSKLTDADRAYLKKVNFDSTSINHPSALFEVKYNIGGAQQSKIFAPSLIKELKEFCYKNGKAN